MKTFLIAGILFLAFVTMGQSQDLPQPPSAIFYGVFHGETPPLRDIPPMTDAEWDAMTAKAMAKVQRPRRSVRLYENLENVEQFTDMGEQGREALMSAPATIVQNFAGQTSPYYPSDCNGTAGPNHYMQTINTVYAIYSKTGTLLAGPTALNTLFSGVTGSQYNDGDPIVLYDEQAERWLVAEFSVSGSNDYMLVAVSTTNDPTGTWYKYSFDVTDMPDYEKFGIWRDGYYMATNTSVGNDVYVLQRDVMLAGGTNPLMIAFDNPWRPNSGFHTIMPLDNDGPFAPASSPGLFITINDNAWQSGTNDQLWIYELAANWSNPASSTFTRTQQINVAAFDSYFGANWNDIIQYGTTQRLDAVPQVIMNVPQYRNFGTYQTIVACHTVDVDNTPRGGIRWYELRKNQGETNWTIRQQGTYAPNDGNSRWMGSIMLNAYNQIALGYSITGQVYPGICITGQTLTEYNAASGILNVAETVIQNGITFQSGTNRWGDYAGMQVDPSDSKTFWFTTQYTGSGGGRSTRITAFTFGNLPVATTLEAINNSPVNSTLHATVNASGLQTTCYFDWGTTTAYGNTTALQTIGNGTENIAVNEHISGLIAGQTYHFRIVATNSDGTVYGQNKTFVAGMASVKTSTITGIGPTFASSGGTVASDGGSTVTARGVCWSTSPNPTLSNPHTVDGSGVGMFTSQLTGLMPNTVYHIRTYATNSIGTQYGQVHQFTTFCPDFYGLPYSENFTGLINIPSCWVRQNSASPPAFNWMVGSTSNGVSTSTPYAYVTFNQNNTSTARLMSPLFDFTGFTNITLSFTHRLYFSNVNAGTITIEYSLDGGINWTTLNTYTSAFTETNYNNNISALNGQANVRLRWNMTKGANTRTCTYSFDNLSITGTPVLYANFSANLLNGYLGSPITFTDASGNGTINSWLWNFGEGSSPATANTQGPHNVIYNTTGLKTVSLTINGSITNTKTNYIGITENALMPPRNLSGTLQNLNGGSLSWLPPKLNDSYEHYTDFNLSFGSYTFYDLDGSNTYSISNTSFPNNGYTGSFIVYNPYKTSPPTFSTWTPMQGRKMLACFASVTPPNNDWLITPRLRIFAGESFSFYARSITDAYGLERLRVGISTSGNQPSDFTIISSGNYIQVPVTWTKYTFNLAAYEGQDVFLAIQCVSNDAFALLLDNLKIESPGDHPDAIGVQTSLSNEPLLMERIHPETRNLSIENESNRNSSSSFAYRITRNGVFVTETNSLYLQEDILPFGEHQYEVKTLYVDPAFESPPSNSTTITVEHTTWMGLQTNNWNEGSNWIDGNIPGQSGKVIIPATASNMPQINAAGNSCTDLIIRPGAQLIIGPTGQLTVSGTLQNEAGTTGLIIGSDQSNTGSLIHQQPGVPASLQRMTP